MNPIEEFIKDYTETADGLWDEVEPQVYDLLLPDSAGAGERASLSSDGMVRVAFDPEALPEHPGSQFMTLGTPLLDRLLEDAQHRGHFGRCYVVGLHLRPHDLERRIARAVDLPEETALELTRARSMTFTNAVFWFSATFTSDQKEQEKFQVALDLHSGRQIRHLDTLLAPAHLSEVPESVLPEARHMPLAEAYAQARGRAVRTVSAIANLRRRDLEDRCQRQEQRMTQYYQDLRKEVEEQFERARSRGQDTARAESRRRAVDQEEKVRLADLRRKNSLRVHLRLLNILEVRQPKLVIHAGLKSKRNESADLTLIWDPQIESLEAPACPDCAQPTFALRFRPKCPTWLCPQCAKQPVDSRKGKKG